MGEITNAINDPRHLRRFLKFEAAGSNNEAYGIVAKSEGISVDSVRASIRMVESYRSRNATAEMNLAVNDLVISTVPHAKAALRGLLTATELVERPDKKSGKTRVVREPDKTTRLEAVRALGTIVKDLQPKQPLVETHVTQTNQSATVISAETNEDRMRRLRQQAKGHNALPPEVAAVPEYIDSGEEDEDDDDEE